MWFLVVRGSCTKLCGKDLLCSSCRMRDVMVVISEVLVENKVHRYEG